MLPGMREPPTYALFDLDGVLLDTEDFYTQATQAVVGRYEKTLDWSLKVRTMGRDARLSAKLIVEELGIPLTPEALLAETMPILESLFARTPAKPGAEAFVRGLRARGLPMAVATSTGRRWYDLKVQGHAWFDAFTAVVCGDDPRVVAKKPSPDIFLAAAQDLGAEPGRCVVFEDSPAGVQAARAAGMRVIALPDPRAGREHFDGANAVVDGWGEVPLSLLGL